MKKINNLNRKNKFFYLLISTNICAFSAYADNPNLVSPIKNATRLESVTVTARRYDEDIKNVPFSVTRLNRGNTDSASANDDIGDMAREVSNLTLTEPGGTYSNTFLLRGVGSLQPMASDDSGVTVYEAGVPKSIISAPVDLFDADRVEIMRGPQGTLFGRNSQGGAIQVVPNLPEFKDSFTLGTGFGNLNQRTGYLIANKVFSNNVAGRIAVRHGQHDGTIKNIVTGDDNGQKSDTSVRASLRWFASNSTEVNFSAWTHRKFNDSPRAILRNNPKFPQVAIAPNNNVKWQDKGTRVEITHEREGMELTSLTSFESSHAYQDMDFTDGLIFSAMTPAPAKVFNMPYGDFSAMNHDEKRWQQEFRLNNGESSDLRWQVGANLFYSQFDNSTTSQAKNRPYLWLNGKQENRIKTFSASLFGEVDVPISDSLRLNAGARLGHERKKANYHFVGNGHPAVVSDYVYQSNKRDTLMSGRLGLSAELTPETTWYGNVAYGTTAGGYPLYSMTLARGKPVVDYPKSSSWTYETGAKWRSADDKTSLNVGFFYNDVRDGHLIFFDRVLGNLNTVVENYRTYGAELEGYWKLSPEWSLSGNVAYTHGKLHEVAANDRSGAKNGNRLANVPTVSASASLSYQQARGLFADVTWQYIGKRAADLKNSFDLSAYSLLNAKIGYGKDNWKVYVFGRNLTDEQSEIAGQSWRNNVQSVRLGEPRLLGVGFEAKW